MDMITVDKLKKSHGLPIGTSLTSPKADGGENGIELLMTTIMLTGIISDGDLKFMKIF